MYLLNLSTSPPLPEKAIIEPVTNNDLKKLTKKKFYFDWKVLNNTQLWKLRLERSQDILGVMSLTYYPTEYRVEINLIASHRENVGTGKKYDRVAGCLIGWACRLSVMHYGYLACVSLLPKTILRKHYINQYGMLEAGMQLFLADVSLYHLIEKYIDHGP